MLREEGRKETESYHSRLTFNLAQCSDSDHHPKFPSRFSFPSFSKDTELCRAVDRPNIFIDPYFPLHKNPFSVPKKTNLLLLVFLLFLPSGLLIRTFFKPHFFARSHQSSISSFPSCVHHFNEGFESYTWW